MRLPPLRLSALFTGGLALIALGLAASVNMRPGEAIVPLFSVVGTLAMMTAATSGQGPRIPH